MSGYGDLILHKYLTTLVIISKIPEGGQLSVRGSEIDIYKGTVMDWFMRKWY